ncbi:MAG: hypothetical protein ABI654_07995 [Betaproteobacteria bacterium]
MNRFIMEEFYNDPALGRRLYEAAHRDRAQAIAAGLAWLFGNLVRLSSQVAAHLMPRRPARWIERLG